MARSERSDRETRGSSSARTDAASGSRAGRRSGDRTGDRTVDSARDTTGATRSGVSNEAPTGTIPVYSPAFPEPDFDLANRAAASATAGPSRPAADEFTRAPEREPRQRPAGEGATASGARRNRPRRPRRAQLQLRHINPWTVLRFSCVLAIALFFVWMIVVGVLYGVLDAAGVINKINSAVTTINGDGSTPPVRASVVFGGAAIIGVVNMILFIALSTIGSVVYNLCADLVGGIEITLSEA